MYKTAFSGALGIALLTTPLLASGQSLASLQAQVQALMAQLQVLQGASASSASGGGSCASLKASMGVGATDAKTGGDVTRLQTFLAQDVSVYPEGMVTGYFGALTEAAVKRWQAKYGVVSSGSAASTGYGFVGPKTRAAMATNCGSASQGQNMSAIDLQISKVNTSSSNFESSYQSALDSVSDSEEGYEEL